MSIVSYVQDKKAFRNIRVVPHGGGQVKIGIRRELLHSALSYTTILHINGSKVYLTEGQRIMIGSGEDCDIRIHDQAIAKAHLFIEVANGKINIVNVSQQKVIVHDELIDIINLLPPAEIAMTLARMKDSEVKKFMAVLTKSRRYKSIKKEFEKVLEGCSQVQAPEFEATPTIEVEVAEPEVVEVQKRK
jgi:hypothetical protein